ncbi:unnamed protein product [Paramecium sonneborni]|uniref:Uncharacterized protein n=1 Tax=Paramecium sonneborni TaxID=65129 RepID=A0A8S1P670_9CILI|nr:unnamed protein product [Paramecium sonneborni]
MFSFGYKNLYEPKPIIPGPGDYELRKDFPTQTTQKKDKGLNRSASSKKLYNDDSFAHRLKNHNDCYAEYQLNTQRKYIELSPKQKQMHSFTTSQRSQCFLLPQISKGPQYYKINDYKTEHSLKIGKYSSRKEIFDIQNYSYSKNNCSKFDQSISIEQKKPQNYWSEDKHQQKYSVYQYQRIKPIPKFREYSYLYKDKIGPSLIDYPKEKIKGRKFIKNQRFKLIKINKADIHQEYFISKLIKDKDYLSSDEIVSNASEETITLKVFDYYQKIFFDKQIKVKKSQQDEKKKKIPGPGNYDLIYQSGKKYSFPKGKRYNKFFLDLL